MYIHIDRNFFILFKSIFGRTYFGHDLKSGKISFWIGELANNYLQTSMVDFYRKRNSKNKKLTLLTTKSKK